MFRFRLHPTPSGFAFGLLGIALWAMMWIAAAYSTTAPV